MEHLLDRWPHLGDSLAANVLFTGQRTPLSAQHLGSDMARHRKRLGLCSYGTQVSNLLERLPDDGPPTMSPSINFTR